MNRQFLFIGFFLSLCGFLWAGFFVERAQALVLKAPPNNLGLVGYWKMDDATSTKATDFSGRGGVGTLNGNATWATGKFGRSVTFDGAGDYISVPNTSSTQIVAGDFTVSAWIYPSAYTSYNTPISKATVSTRELTIHIPSNTQFFLHAGETNTGTIGISPGFSLNEWQLLTVVRSGSTATIYRNGVSVGSSGGINGTATTNQPLNIGGNDAGGNADWNGRIDDVRMYTRALSVSEIGSLYNAGIPVGRARDNTGLVAYYSFEDGTSTKATDFSGNGNTATLTNGPTWTSAGKRGKAVSFAGGSDYVSVPANSQTLFTPGGQYSVAAWFKKTNAANNDGAVFSQYGSGTSAEIRVIVRDGAGDIQGLYIDDGSTIRFQYTPSFVGRKNQWQHVTLTNNNGSAAFYINGVQVASSTYSVTAATFDGIFIGRSGSGAYPFTGQIDDARIYNRALSATDVANLYAAGATTANPTIKTVSRNGLLAYWSLDDGTGTKATDFSGNGNTGSLISTPTWTEGKRGKALSFSGSNYVSSTGALFQSIGSAVIWIKPSAASGSSFSEEVWSANNASNDKFRFLHFTDNNWYVCWSLFDDAGPQIVFADSLTPFAANTWHQFAFTWNDTTNNSFVYFDGVQVASNNNVSTRALTTFQIGQGWTGSLDDVRIYSRMLSADEIRTLYQVGR